MALSTSWTPKTGTPKRPSEEPIIVDRDSVATNLPPRDPKFVGRFSELREIHDSITRQSGIGLTQAPVPHRYGGVGKTALAIAYGWEKMCEYPGGVFFIRGDAPLYIAELASLAGLLGIKPAPTLTATAEAVINQLASGLPSLLIIDNVVEPQRWYEAVQTNVIPQGNCRRLVTSRRSQLENLHMSTIGRLPRDQAVRLLGNYRTDADDRANEVLVGRVIDVLDGLPIALAVVGSQMTISSHLDWETFGERMKEKGWTTPTESDDGGISMPDYHACITSIFDDLLGSLSIQHRMALEFASLLPKRVMMTKWLVELLQTDACKSAATQAGGQSYEPSVVISDLIFLQLLRSMSAGHKSLSMHVVLRDHLRERFTRGQFVIDNSLELILKLAERRSHIGSAAAKKPTLRAELTPLLYLAGELHARGHLTTSVRIVNQLAPALHDLGRDAETIAAIDRYKATEVTEKLTLSDAAIVISNKAAAFASTGDLQAAKRLMEHALQIEQRHVKPDDPVLAIRHSNLAGILKSLGNLIAARQHIETAIAIEVKSLGPDHPNLALRHWWMADIDMAEGRKAKAIEQYERARSIMAKHAPPNHPQLQRLTKICEQHRGTATASS